MVTPEKVVIADHDERSRNFLVEVIRKEGYHCDCAANTEQVLQLLESDSYDLLIADIEIPGNNNLELIRHLPDSAEGLPVILMTDLPSLDTAIESINMKVAAYLVKPFSISLLLSHIKEATDINHTRKTMHSVRKNTTPVSVDAFMALTFNNVVSSLADLKNLTETLEQGSSQGVCNLLNCPRLTSLRDSIKDSVMVLENTKNSFKSKELADLRKKLESLAESLIIDN